LFGREPIGNASFQLVRKICMLVFFVSHLR
jgi:hypothetical protein